MSGNNINSRTVLLSISLALLALAKPAVAEVSIEQIDRDLVFCAPAEVLMTVKVGSDPFNRPQLVTFNSSHPAIAHVEPDPLVFPWTGGTLPCVLKIELPVAASTQVDIIAVNTTAGGHDQVTVTILPNQARYYVDHTADGYGSSWDDAFKDLADALSAAAECPGIVDEIWVAEGTYKPSSRSASFVLLSDLAIYGGFLGGETSLDDRDYAANETILSGNIGAAGDDTDNTYHVVIGTGTSATAILDGFTITGGYADGSSEDSRGGGMYSGSASPTLRHCTFSFNYADSNGGGMSSFGNPTLIDCRFSENSSDGDGGGMSSFGNPTLIDCRFSENSSPHGNGGGMYSKGDPTLNDCTFDGNSAGVYGGGMYISLGDPTLMNCTFNENSADGGGGACVRGDSSEGASPTLTNCEFNGNTAARGGGIQSTGAESTLTNCTFVGNLAAVSGGGIYSTETIPPLPPAFDASTLTNCTFGANTAGRGDALSANDSNPVLTNCILWNTGDEVEEVSSMITITYSDVQGGWEGEGNIDGDPLFAGPNDGDLSLSAGSPCIDAANSLPAPSFDADGKGRAVDDPDTPNTGSGPADFVDMGAYEYRPMAAFADLDGDGDVDLEDAAEFLLLFTGPM
ncbi:MAG: choice-of-anchor Q domain-containing protein [Planctomycetota bacterium]|jgi:predicted outer membrane repeat protein